MHLNPFSSNVPLLYQLKTSENLRYSDIFKRYRSGTLVENGLSMFREVVIFIIQHLKIKAEEY